MNRVILFTLLLIAMVAQGEDSPATEPPCFWLGSAPLCDPNKCPDDTTEFTRASAGKSHYQHAQEFGNDCKYGQKVLCCKNEAIYADPYRHCGYFLDAVCPVDGTTVFMQRGYLTSFESTLFHAFCCKPFVFGMKTN